MEIVVNNLSYSYYKNISRAIDNINITIQSYKINTIIGPTGSGKTTLIKLISGALKPTEGQIRTDEKNKIALVLQNSEVRFFKNSVKEELKEVNSNIDITEIIKIVNLDEYFLNEHPDKLNNSNKLKLSIAKAIIYEAETLVFDNPTVNLEHKSKKEFINLIKTLKKDYQKTIIIVSNDIDTIHTFTDYIFVMNQGTIILEGTKYDVFKEEKFLNNNGIKVPKIISFSNCVHESKNIKMGYRDQINDLLKDIYRYAK